MTYRITVLIAQVIGHLLSQSTFQNPLHNWHSPHDLYNQLTSIHR